MEPLKDKEGKVWKPYLMGYETENAKFISIFYAISKEHAALVIQDIKDSAILVGEVVRKEDFL
jgi:hypothetical protein